MQLAVVTVIRNERDIAGAFLSHLAALFDHAVLLDHGSVDGTQALLRDACADRAAWQCWQIDLPGHHQALASNYAMRHLFRATAADYVLFLDADEFIDVPDRAALEHALVAIEGERTAGVFEWTDCLPDRLDGEALQIGDPIWARPGEQPFPKIVVSRRFFEATGGMLRPSSGNHTVEPRDGGPVDYRCIGRLLHLPVRSVVQLRQKIITGSLAVLARSDNAPHESSHWFGALRRLAQADLTESDLIHLATRYGHEPESWEHVARSDLPGLGFTSRKLDVAGPQRHFANPPAPPGAWQVVAAAIAGWRADDGRAFELELDGTVLRPAASRPAEAIVSAVVEDLEKRLADALSAAAIARNEVAVVRASTSYRVTAPLRAMMYYMGVGGRSG